MTIDTARDISLKMSMNKQGRRLTNQRLAILNYLRGVTTHPTCEMIYHALKSKLPKLSLATVYRNVKYLADNNLVLQVKGDDGKTHYDGNTKAHLHLICKNCQKIYDIWTKKVPAFKDIPEVAEVDNIDCTIYGTCSNCKKN